MGLSSKQVSSDHQGLDWTQTLLQAQTLDLPKQPPSMKRHHQQLNQQTQSEPLKCPRCDSTNTKFCYYNNYNKSQPRHFCKTCKRHWTKGGTLRNVPVGGGRKNKRPKTSKPSTATTTTTGGAAATNNRLSTHLGIRNQKQKQSFPFALCDEKITNPEISYPGLRNFSPNYNGVFVGSNLAQNQDLGFQFSSSSSSNFETNPSSISTSLIQPSNISSVCHYNEDQAIETHPWQVLTTSGTGVDMAAYWNWDDINTLVSSTDLNIPWDDSEIKP